MAKKQQAAAHADDEPAVAGQMKLTDLWRPYGHTLSFFLHCGHTCAALWLTVLTAAARTPT